MNNLTNNIINNLQNIAKDLTKLNGGCNCALKGADFNDAFKLLNQVKVETINGGCGCNKIGGKCKSKKTKVCKSKQTKK